MSFFVYDMIFLGAFILFLTLFLIIKRKNVKRQGILILYHTNVGIKLIEKISKRYNKLLSSIKWLVIASGYALMIGMLYLVGQLLYVFSNPEFVKIVKIPPFAPLVPYIGEIFNVSFLPPFYFTYWIIVIAIVAVSHEFSHGIYARIAKVKVKSTGFGFLGPFIAAFVEPDEKKIAKIRKRDQLAILTAGTFANLIITALFFIVMIMFFMLSFAPSGVIFNDYIYSAVNIASISSIGNISLDNPNIASIQNALENTQEIRIIDNASFVLIKADGRDYLLDTRIKDIENYSFSQIIVYDSLPAINSELKGSIIEVDGKKITDYESFAGVIREKSPGETINIKTRYNQEIREYNLELAEDPSNKSRAIIGIGFYGVQETGLIKSLVNKMVFYKEPFTEYLPRYNPELAIFLYNLLWWIVLINLSVALMNMLPLGIFDGGRVFYVTMLAILKKKKRAEIAYKIATWLFLGIFALLIVFWIFGII